MASRQPTNASPLAAEKPTAQHVGNIFVTNYYNVQKKLPNEFHKFYEDNSMVVRPDDNGVILSVNKKQVIDQNILLIGDGMQMEIKAVAAQYSVDFGLIVVVKGCLISVGGVKRGFNQNFFLDLKVNAPKDIRAPFAVPPSVSAKPQPSMLTAPAMNQPSKLSAPTSSKVSYVSSGATEESFSQEVDCCSVFVGNLPMNVTVNQLREEFKKFGAIKPMRIQIRRNEERRFCFAFLEFELASAAARAIKLEVLLGGLLGGNVEMEAVLA